MHGRHHQSAAAAPDPRVRESTRQAITEIVTARRRLDALFLKALHAADLDDVGSVNGSTSTGAWLGHETLADETDARAEVRLAAA